MLGFFLLTRKFKRFNCALWRARHILPNQKTVKMKKMKLLILVATLFGLNSFLSAGDVVPEYSCYRLATAPTMDGKLDDAGWQELPEAGGFFIHGGKDRAIEKRTFFRAGWTDDSLYLQVRCFEPLTDKMKASTTEGDALWADDAIEMFFQPLAGSNYYQLVANSVGTRWNAVGPESKEAKPWNWTVRSGRWEKGWLLEVRIPFAVLGRTPKAGEVWPVNIARDTTTGPAVEGPTCWPPLEKGFNDLERFGRFVFSAAAPAAAQVKADEARWNEPFNQYLKDQCAAKIKDAEGSELIAALENPLLAAEGKPILEVLAQLKSLQARADADPNDRVVMLTTWRNLMDVFSEKAKKLDIPLVKVPLKKLAMEINARDAGDVKLWVNGKAVNALDGNCTLSLKEGVNVIGMTVAATAGKAPALRLRIPGQPELESRWRVGTAANESWLTPAFDDRTWKKAEVDKEGYLCVPEGSVGDVCFRQIVLWGENYYSGLPGLLPKVREWGFSEKSMETLFHPLYSPLSFPLDEYEFVLDVPKGFSLLEEKYPAEYKDAKGGRLSRRPQKVTTEDVLHDNKPYVRYRFAYESKFVPSGKPDNLGLIPLILNEFPGADKLSTFYFRRLAAGNLTELEQALPVRILPPINGRMLKNVAIQQYVSPWRLFSGGRLFPEHLNALMRQSFDAGFNRWIIGAWEGEYGKNVSDQVTARGGTVGIGYNNYPIHGNCLGATSALGKLMLATPESQARYFDGTGDWTKRGRFCPTFATGAGAAQFKDAVKQDIAMMKNGGVKPYVGFPMASIYFTDWETKPWVDAGVYASARKGDGSYCFCDRCKAAFRKYAKLPDTADLSDDAIFKNYKQDWSRFREQLDGRVNGVVKECCNELGLQSCLYDDTSLKNNWIANKGKIDLAFPGCPGDGLADSGSQQYLDRVMTFFRDEVGLSSIVGQLFASSYDEAGALKMAGPAWEKDGFLNPKKVKTQILRVVAAFRGGVDLNTSVERCAGSHYYVGEATRIISEYEDLFSSGERADHLAASAQIKYPNLLVLKKGKDRLVLLFNEGAQPIRVLLENKELGAGQKATIFGVNQVVEQAAKMEVTVAPQDVAVVHIN